MDLSELLNEETLESIAGSIGDWFAKYVFVGSTAIQLTALLLGFFIAWRLAPKACHWLRVHRPAGLQKIVYTLIEVMQSLMWLVTVWLAIGVAVLADSTWAAMQGARALAVEWRNPQELDSTGVLYERFRKGLNAEAVVVRRDGDAGQRAVCLHGQYLPLAHGRRRVQASA